MPTARDIHGTVFQQGTSVLMARIVDATGQAITRAAIDAIRYWVYELDPCRPDNLEVVAGHDEVGLDVDEVVFDTLQNDDSWTLDQQGYNFRHLVDVEQAEAFPAAGASYQVRYELTPTTGQKVIVRFQLRAI